MLDNKKINNKLKKEYIKNIKNIFKLIYYQFIRN